MSEQSAMQRLSYYDSLSHKVSIYIPSTVNVDKRADNSKVVRQAIVLFSRLFGGASSYKVTGGWMSDSRGLVTEDTTIVYSNFKDFDNDKLNTVIDFAERLKVEMKQEAIALDIDSKLYFI